MHKLFSKAFSGERKWVPKSRLGVGEEMWFRRKARFGAIARTARFSCVRRILKSVTRFVS